MIVDSGAVCSGVKENRDTFGPWMVVNRQKRVPKNKGLRDGGKESNVGESNKYIVLKLKDENKE